MIIDSHCHLNFKQIKCDLDGVISRAVSSGVSLMQSVCTSMDEFDEIRAIADSFAQVYCSVGVHPLNVEKNAFVDHKEILSNCNFTKVSSIGETGLDYFKSQNIEQQKQLFEQHIIASQETGLPIIIHSRSAESDTVEILKKHMKRGKFTGVMHCFTGSLEFAQECIGLGLYISASGVVTFKNTNELRNVFKNIPESKILVETDSPFLSPVPHRGKSNEPSYIVHTVEFLASFLGIELEKFKKITSSNFFELFRKIPSCVKL
ncbi:TatD family deoxyribonuclease [Candidatus Cyrtobacter comes]|uniref:TatD family deoxyribonuclease n=1 Tax=Candidatus Cyrtobacter comes TaxID=675776 RepID=A0ABU5L6D3_9RICK|nr:TatD family hydrolase [Candidatus Cyrtobacter comes]MDZ5761682.1 TatD family deoxyribonuclease [Candidatus Cyrtobacter comes]